MSVLLSFSCSSYLNQRGDSPGVQKGSQGEQEAFGDLLLRMSYEIRAQGVDAAACAASCWASLQAPCPRWWMLQRCCPVAPVLGLCPRLWVMLVEGAAGSARCWVSAEQEEALKWNSRLRS